MKISNWVRRREEGKTAKWREEKARAREKRRKEKEWQTNKKLQEREDRGRGSEKKRGIMTEWETGEGEKKGEWREKERKREKGGRWRDGDKEARECKREREVYLDRHCKTHLSMGREGGGGGSLVPKHGPMIICGLVNVRQPQRGFRVLALSWICLRSIANTPGAPLFWNRKYFNLISLRLFCHCHSRVHTHPLTWQTMSTTTENMSLCYLHLIKVQVQIVRNDISFTTRK